MNPFVKALLPSLGKLLAALLGGAFLAGLLTFSNVVSAVTTASGGTEIIPLLRGLTSAAFPIFIVIASVIYGAWSFVQLMLAFSKGKEPVVKPQRVDNEQIEVLQKDIGEPEELEENKENQNQTESQTPVEQPKKEDKIDPYFDKYLKEEDVRREEEE